jgi:glycosyltransferase involved in cell wall biosynthesis
MSIVNAHGIWEISATGASVGPSLRVCHLGKFYPPASGGIETHLQTLAQAQARLGLAVQVLCVNHRDRRQRDVTWRPFAATSTVAEHDGPVKVVRLGRRASIARFDFCPRLPQELWRIGPDDCDLLHLHVPNPTMVLALFACRPRVPWVITYHSDVVRQRTLARLQRPFENWLFRRARAIVATSPEYPRGSEYLGRYSEKVSVVPFGIDLQSFLQPGHAALNKAEEFRRTMGEPLWLCVGRLVYYKGLDNAIKALARVPGRLMIVGDGPLRGELQRLAIAEGVADRIAWHTRLSAEELVGAYRACTALWFPSNARSEAFGFVQIEAMASGRPVLNTAIPGSGVAWVSRHDETGLTVPVDDWQALAAAARRLWEDAERRTRLGQNAQERAKEEFDADQMARRTLQLYRGALGLTAPAHEPMTSPRSCTLMEQPS